jgi:predicted transcriptional regulator
VTTRKITLKDFAKDKTLGEHTRRSRAVARALDARADALPYAHTFTTIGFEQFVTELTPKRFELLRLAIKNRASIGELATATHRDHSAVSKDVVRLQKLGLLGVETVARPGHGQVKIVIVVATRIEIEANLAAA